MNLHLPASWSALWRTRPARAPLPDINLYPADPFYESIFGRGLQWATSVGRHIVIFTEIVVIGSFFSRFVLDRQLTDLNRSILQKQAIVQSYGDLETKVRRVQTRSKDVANILQQQERYAVMQTLQAITPADVKYEQISLVGDKFAVEGKALSSRSLDALVQGFRQQNVFEQVSIHEIQSGDARDPGISFSISARYQQGLAAVNTGGGATRPTSGDGAEPTTAIPEEESP